MADVGLLPTGFVPDTIPNIRAEMELGMRSTFSASMPLGNRTLLGYMIGALSERLGLLWEIAELCFQMMDPDQATGAYLEALCLLTATFRAAAEMSLVVLTLCGDDGTVVAAENVVTTASTGKNFRTFDDKTITLLPDWIASHAYVVGFRVTNANRGYQCITAGVSDSSGGPLTTATDITDGAAHWTYLGEGKAAVDVVALSEDTGAVIAVARDLSVIGTPVGGWNTATNLKDAKPGRDEMADEELRLTREADLAEPGSGTPDAVRAELVRLDGVTHATVFFNLTEIVDVNGVPPHTAEVLVQGGDDQQIRDLLWANIPLGIGTVGTTVGTALDSEGKLQEVSFSRPTTKTIYAYIALEKNARTYGGDVAVETAIATWSLSRGTGDDVEPSAVSGQVFKVDGVKKVTDVRVYTDVIAVGAPWVAGTAYVATPGARSVVTNDGRSYICTTAGTAAGSGPGPLGLGADVVDGTVHWYCLEGSIAIGTRELALYDTSRIAIASVDQSAP